MRAWRHALCPAARKAAAHAHQPTHSAHGNWRLHWYRPVYGLRKNAQSGGAVNRFCLYDHRLYAVLRHACNVRAATFRPQLQILQRFCRRPAWAVGRVFYRLDLLVLLGRHRYRRCGRHQRLFSILVSRFFHLDEHHALCNGFRHLEHPHGENVWRNGILVRCYQNCRHCGAHYRWRDACGDAGAIVIPHAANTCLTGGSTPDGDAYDRDIVILSTTRMNKIRLINDASRIR